MMSGETKTVYEQHAEIMAREVEEREHLMSDGNRLSTLKVPRGEIDHEYC